ncbi:MAG TPA: hypothetical protein VN683_10325 [Acidothermaceae bacterium]|nr:hypothetical protein [Acidothermaceae bacterium]
MYRTPARAAAWTLLAGSVIATIGYLAAFLANGNSDGRFSGSSWTTLYTLALFGDVLVALGLPALLYVQAERASTLTRIGYAGILVPLLVLNVGEGCIEAFVKPYLAVHGGSVSKDLPGLAAFEAPALLIMLIGMICLGIAVLRAHILPRWVGVAFIVVPFLGAAGIPGAAGLVPDYLLFVALFAVGTRVLRSGHDGESAVPHSSVTV